MVVLDTYQSAGTVPFSVKELNADFATGGSVKWLCGGPGAGYLYVRPDLQDKLEPKTTGWMAHESPFAFDTSLRGNGNGGHTYGRELSVQDREALLEYLKTL